MRKKSRQIPVFKPLLPTADRLLPYLKQIDTARYYTNRGPLLRLFEAQLARHFNVPTECVVTASNGTQGLTQILRTLKVQAGSVCLMPSWTFIATPAAAIGAGLVPYFLDVSQETWALSPEDVEVAAQKMNVGSVIVVSPFGAPLPYAAWERFQKNTGIPVIIDAAASFDSFTPLPTRLPCMVSLHATTVFGIGEGAVLLTQDEDFASQLRAYGHFGFSGTRTAIVSGGNTKLTEYAAAIGLAALEAWPETRQNWQNLTDSFVRIWRKEPADWVSSYGNILIPDSVDIAGLMQVLAQEHIGSIQWWSTGCHHHPAYESFGMEAHLPVTNYLGRRVLGLPFWLGLSETDIDYIFWRVQSFVEKRTKERAYS